MFWIWQECEGFTKKKKLAACHSNLTNPMNILSQVCKSIVGFKEKLLDQLKRAHEVRYLKNPFAVYLQNPLDELEINKHERLLLVIDGLDESAADNKNEIVNLIADYFSDLPDYKNNLVTSRSEISLAKLNGLLRSVLETMMLTMTLIFNVSEVFLTSNSPEEREY